MTELHVGAGFALRTLAQAAAVAKSGDTVIVHSGVYAAGFRPPAGTTWVGAEDEARPVIDGGWDGSRVVEATASQVLVTQPDVTLRGLEVRNVRGRGVTVGAGGDNFTMEQCEIHHTVNGGFGANGTGTTIRNLTLRDCYLHDLSLSGRWQETPVNGCCIFRYVDGLRVSNVHVRGGHAEGFSLDPWTENAVVSNLLVEDTTHLGVYVSNRARHVLFEHCVIVQRGLDEWRQGDGDVGNGFVVGDEVSGDKTAKWPHADDIIVRNCIVINAGAGIGVRNNRKIVNGKADGYDTRPERMVFENNTIIAGPDMRVGVEVFENPFGGKVAGTFRNNLFVLDRLPPGAVALKTNAPGVTFVDNAWTAAVPAGLPASNRSAAATALVAPFAPLGEELAIDNYRPRANGPLDGAGLGALEALPVDPPVDPPLEPPDWAALLALAAEVDAHLATTILAAADTNRALLALKAKIVESKAA